MRPQYKVPDVSIVATYVSRTAAIRWFRSAVSVYFMPKSSTMRVKEMSRVAWQNIL